MLKGWSIYSNLFDPELIKNIPSVGNVYILSRTNKKPLDESPIAYINTSHAVIRKNTFNGLSIIKFQKKLEQKFCFSNQLKKQKRKITSQKKRDIKAQAMKEQDLPDELNGLIYGREKQEE